MIELLARYVFMAAVAVVTYLALTPGPLGAMIESSEGRHVLAFAMLPALSSIGWPSIRARWQFLGYAAFGGAIELAQGFMALGRSMELYDWLVDMAAAAISLGLAHLVRRSPMLRTA